MGEDRGAERNVRLYGPAGSYPQDCQCPVFLFRLACGEVHIREGVQLGHHDVDVVRSDSGRQHGDSLAVVFSGCGDELPWLVTELDVGKESGDHIDSSRVADENDDVSQLFRFQMDVERWPVIIDDKFRFCYSHNMNFNV